MFIAADIPGAKRDGAFIGAVYDLAIQVHLGFNVCKFAPGHERYLGAVLANALGAGGGHLGHVDEKACIHNKRNRRSICGHAWSLAAIRDPRAGHDPSPHTALE